MSLKKNKKSVDPSKPKTTAAQIRVQKDLVDLDNLPNTMTLHFPDPNNGISDIYNHDISSHTRSLCQILISNPNLHLL